MLWGLVSQVLGAGDALCSCQHAKSWPTLYTRAGLEDYKTVVCMLLGGTVLTVACQGRATWTVGAAGCMLVLTVVQHA